MTFMYPLGLLALIGIPVIIIIYILQSTFTEQTVNSNYLWHLSEKFMKRKNPLSGISGIISLILQLLTVAIIAMVLSRPIITLPNAAKNYCFVLDASSSMNMYEDRETRFDNAKDEIERVIKKAKNGSTYSLVYVSNDESVRAFDNISDKKTAIELTNEVKPSQTSTSYTSLLNIAQSIFDNDPATLVYLVTDKSYNTHQNIEIIDVGNENTENYGIFDVEYSHSAGRLKINANAVSYVSDKGLEIKAYIDGRDVGTSSFDVKAGEMTPISLDLPCESFDKFKLEILNSDGYLLDNSVEAYNLKGDKTYSVLIVSDTGFFFKAVIDALVDSKIDIVSPDEYENIKDEYGLYIFDSYTPSELPNGAVWLINAYGSVENSGFGVKGKVELEPAELIKKSNSTSTNVRHMLRGVGDGDIYITSYIKYSGMYLNFHTLYS